MSVKKRILVGNSKHLQLDVDQVVVKPPFFKCDRTDVYMDSTAKKMDEDK